jgi:hypothetical protein
MAVKTRIIDVERKPSKCPVCGSEVADIIYGTGDLTEMEFLYAYRKSAIMGGDNIPRRPPIWACMCGCKRFRKVNPDGSDAPVKVKLLKNVRKASLSRMIVESPAIDTVPDENRRDQIHHYQAHFVTEYNETDTIGVTAISEEDAIETVRDFVNTGMIGLQGIHCKSIEIVNKDA